MPQGGKLVVSTGRADKTSVFVEVRDSGIGIAPEKLEQIFTPFYTDKNRGTGLGLTIAKNIVDKHEGQIEVTSVPGQGSTFRILLPLHPQPLA